MSTIRTGIIGAGGMAAKHLPAWLRLGADVTVYSDHGAPDLTARFGGTVASSVSELLDRCDLVDVVTPTPVHHHYVTAALQAGKDVICEKPLTRHHDEAVEVVRLARRQGRHLFPAHVVRYRSQYATMRAAVQQGRIGVPAISRFSRIAPFPTWSAWFADPEQSGGLVLDVMIHDLDIARWVSGEVSQVYATQAQAHVDGAPITTAHALLTHTSGALSHVTATWGPPGVRLATSFHIAGTDGVLSHDTAAEDSLRPNLRAGSTFTPAITSAHSNPFVAQLRDYTHAITAGTSARISARDGLIAVDLALAAIESIQTGTTVPFTTWDEE